MADERPIHALGCHGGVSMGDRDYPAWRFGYAACGCIDVFECPAADCFGVLSVRSGPRCHEVRTTEDRKD
jgi:hypothetical protein